MALYVFLIYFPSSVADIQKSYNCINYHFNAKNSQKYKLYKQNYICIFISYQINFPCFINARRRLKLLKWWYVWVRYVFTVCWYWFKTQIRWTRDCLRDSSQGGAFSSFATSKLIFPTEFLQTSCFWKIYAEKIQTKASLVVDLKIQGLVTVAQCKIVTIHSKPVMLKKNTYNNYILWPHTTALGQFLKKTIKRCQISRFRTSWQARNFGWSASCVYVQPLNSCNPITVEHLAISSSSCCCNPCGNRSWCDVICVCLFIFMLQTQQSSASSKPTTVRSVSGKTEVSCMRGCDLKRIKKEKWKVVI